MPKGKILTKKQILTIPLLKKQGLTTNEIAIRFKVTPRTVRNWSIRLRKASHTVPKDPAGRKKVIL